MLSMTSLMLWLLQPISDQCYNYVETSQLIWICNASQWTTVGSRSLISVPRLFFSKNFPKLTSPLLLGTPSTPPPPRAPRPGRAPEVFYFVNVTRKPFEGKKILEVNIHVQSSTSLTSKLISMHISHRFVIVYNIHVVIRISQ